MRLKLVDTSVWIDHFRKPNQELSKAMERGEVLVHPFVLAEIALGGLRQRDLILDELQSLPLPVVAGTDEVLEFIRNQRLWSTGLGYVDVHLLASFLLTRRSVLWTRDKRLMDAAARVAVTQLPTPP